MKRYDCYGKDDFGYHYAALHDEDPGGDYYLASDVAARDAQCLELLKTLGHEGKCPAGIPGFLRRKGSDLIACNCNRSKIAALLGRMAG